MEKIIVLNPIYLLKNDIKRIILTTSNGEGITTFIHPLHAMILSFFDSQIIFSENIKRISFSLNLKEDEIIEFISKILNNSEKIWIGEGINASHFPENILIDRPKNYIERNYHFRNFIINGNNIDLSSKRFYIPIETTLMINSTCYTDCVYCYADRDYSFDALIPFERLCEIIDEAKALNFRKFETSGGEFFLYKNWEKLLEKLISNGFNPTIPTKVPLNINHIQKIKEKGLKQIQISLDTINEENLKSILNVTSTYWSKLMKTFHELERSKIKFRVNTIITSYNCNFEEINNLIEYLMQYEYFEEVSIGIVAYTLYKSNLQNNIILPNKTNVDTLMSKLLEKYGNNEKVRISDVQLHQNNYHFSKHDFYKKAICTGNMHLFYILADGKVTLCEELYWHPKFIIGDLKKQSIMEMWSSERALEFYNVKQDAFSEKSACKRCNDFNYCHKSGGKCWREILKGYGKDNWDYPDPRCPYSPEPVNKIYIG